VTKPPPHRIRKEEIANSVTHGIGLLLRVAGLAVLVVLAALNGSAWHIVSCSVYGATLAFLYLASALYHNVQSPRLKRTLKLIDHSSIYLLIAGTCTPFTLVNLDRVPATGATLVVLPMKIKGGTGGPTRIVGILP